MAALRLPSTVGARQDLLDDLYPLIRYTCHFGVALVYTMQVCAQHRCYNEELVRYGQRQHPPPQRGQGSIALRLAVDEVLVIKNLHGSVDAFTNRLRSACGAAFAS